MKVLLVASTWPEIAPLARQWGDFLPPAPGKILTLNTSISALVTGVGQMQAAYHLACALSDAHRPLVLNVGVAGSFLAELPKRSVVLVEEEVLADLGAESDVGMLDLFDMGLLLPDASPFQGGVLRAATPHLRSLDSMRRARSVTVNRVLALEESIERVVARYSPAVVNMEGAAIFYACILKGLECISLRGVSDRVGPRDKSEWDIAGAVAAVCASAQEVLVEYLGESPAIASSV